MLRPHHTAPGHTPDRLAAASPARRRIILRRMSYTLTPLLIILILIFSYARAAELIPSNVRSYMLETMGPKYPISSASWYSNPVNGIGVGYYYAQIDVPCGWPADKPVSVDLFSPEMSSSGSTDEPRSSGALSTTFELYQPGTAVGPGIAEPGPGAPGSIASTAYPPSSAASKWERFYTLPAPVACGAYILRSEAQDDDGNIWRLRAGYDDDGDPTNTPPLDEDNPDGLPGTGDELTVAAVQTALKHPQNPRQCLSLYEFVQQGQLSVAFHNFDMEASGKVTYYSPSGAALAGTVSQPKTWNNGTLTDRGPGDTIANPEPGWWRIESCGGSDYHFIQEGQRGVPAYYDPPATPRIVVSKDDGRTVVGPKQLLTYTIALTNTADQLAVPGAAWDVVISDTLPPNVTYQACALSAPLAGTCALSGGVVTFDLDGKIDAGAGGSVQVTVKTNPSWVADTIKNDVTVDYQDDLANRYSAAASDTDALIVRADLRLTKGVDKVAPQIGDELTYTVKVINDGPDDASGVAVSDALPPEVTFRSALASHGSYNQASGSWTIGELSSGAMAILRITVIANVDTTITNTAQVSASDQPDPDSTPNNNNPNEDDQASVTTPIAPTAVTLVAFTARAGQGGVTIAWETSAEIDTWGFDLYRSPDGSWERATRATAQPIPGRGRGQGASYSWADTSPEAAGAAAYWLVETEAGGATNRYGPAIVTYPPPGARPTYLPIAIR